MNRTTAASARTAQPSAASFVAPVISPEGLIQQGLRYHRAGQLQAAETLYRQALQIEPRSADALHLLGVLAHQAGANEKAAELIGKAIALNGKSPDFHNNLGLALQALGKFERAAASYRAALKLNPDSAEAHNNLGNALRDQGKIEEALASYRKALLLNPGYAEARYNLGTALQAQGNLDEAAENYRQALRIKPGYAKAQNNLGAVLQMQGNPGEATACYRQALMLDPNFGDAHVNLGNILRDQGKPEEAVASYREALRSKPECAEIHFHIGDCLQAQGKNGEAIACYLQALALNPGFIAANNNLGNAFKALARFDEAKAAFQRALAQNPGLAEVHLNLGSTLQQEGRTAEASACYAQAQALRPNDGIRIKQAILLPAMMGGHQEILESRQEFERKVDGLLNERIALTEPAREVGGTGFFLAYHGMNDRELQLKLAKLYEQACPSLLYAAPHCRSAGSPVEGRKIRIGFVSMHFKDHTIGRLTAGIIANLSRGLFSPRVFFLNRQMDEVSRSMARNVDHSAALPFSLDAARREIAEQELDILFYPDIGMDFFTYFLAYSRLAPVQCVTWGHPVTTGIRNIDYFISSNDLEPVGAEAHYSEKLIRLNGLPAYYYRPTLPEPLKDRSHFGLENSHHVYLCPQTLFKFHPDFDPVLAEILRRDPAGQLVLIEGTYRHWTELLRQRFTQFMPDVMERIHFVPRQSGSDFLNLIAVSDVILDPFHFGGGNTAYEALAVGTPIVTLPAEFMRGRVTYACYRKMGVMDCVTDSPDHYVELAVRLGTDRSFREEIKAKILASNSSLYEDASALRELEQFFVDALKENRATPETNGSNHA